MSSTSQVKVISNLLRKRRNCARNVRKKSDWDARVWTLGIRSSGVSHSFQPPADQVKPVSMGCIAFSTEDFGAGGKESFQGTICKVGDSGSMTRSELGKTDVFAWCAFTRPWYPTILNRGFRNAIDFPHLPPLLPAPPSSHQRRIRRDSA